MCATCRGSWPASATTSRSSAPSRTRCWTHGVTLTELASLDLYRQPDPFRTPARDEYRDWIDALEVATMWTGGFPEPLTFSLRARRHLAARRGEFDVVHDNQTLGYGLLGLDRGGPPLVTTIHHPITVDRRLELAAASTWQRRLSVRRWYGFTRMQKRVARRLPSVLTVSGSSRREIIDDLGVSARPGTRGADRRRHPAVLARPRGPRRAGPDRHHLQRRRPPQGPGPPGRGAGQAAHRTPRRPPGRGRQAPGDRPGRRGRRGLRTGERRRLRQGHQRRRTGRPDARRPDRLRPLALRGLLAARRRGDGHRHTAGRHHRRCHTGGGRRRRRDLPRGPTGRRGRARRRARPAALGRARCAGGSGRPDASGYSTASPGNRPRAARWSGTARRSRRASAAGRRRTVPAIPR